MRKKVVVMGYHNIGCRCLKVLVARGVSVEAVFTHQDDPKEEHWFGSLADLARSYNIPVYFPENPNTPEWLTLLKNIQPDVIFSFYYRLMIAQGILDIPRYGAINLHGSLLPKYRGRCPVNWQILKGETESGVTLHHMVKSADAGDIIAQKSVPIGPDETALELFKKLEVAAEELLAEQLEGILSGTAPRHPQDRSKASYFGGRKPEDGRIDWCSSAQEIHNLVRAVTTPYPGAYGFLNWQKIMIWKTRWHEDGPESQKVLPGTVFPWQNQLCIKAGKGFIEPLNVSLGAKEEKSPPPVHALLTPGNVLA